jgi:AcrR family transcriptional regulator
MSAKGSWVREDNDSMTIEDRKEREKQARRKEILLAAEELFSRQDFHEVTIDQIAAKAELSKGAVYLYFRTKDELFFSLIREEAMVLLDRLRAAMKGESSFVERLTDLVRQYFSFFEEHRAFFKLMHSEKSRTGANIATKFHEEMRGIFAEFLDFYNEVMEMGKTEGVLRDLPTMYLVHNLQGLLDSLVFHWVFLGSGGGLVEESERVIDLFLHGTQRRGD